MYNADYNYFYYNAVLVVYFDLLVPYMLHIIAILYMGIGQIRRHTGDANLAGNN